MVINIDLVRLLVSSQFPKWKDLPIYPVALSGWDNRTFHLGEDMLIRMPSAAEYASQVEKEHKWLPKLAPFLPFAIPTCLAMGQPAEGYPWRWSIYKFLEGDSAASMPMENLCDFAKSLAQFLVALESIDKAGGPVAGAHSFFRGGSLKVYDDETRRAIKHLQDKVDSKVAIEIWEKALSTTWTQEPVWVHGDISVGNLLTQKGKLSAVIDFGQLAVGDPACDLVIAWTLFKGESREAFQETMHLDDDTWDRASGWCLWKAVVVAAGFTNPNNTESLASLSIINELLMDFKSKD